MTGNDSNGMREFILLLEEYRDQNDTVAFDEPEPDEEPDTLSAIINDLNEVIFRLRSYMDPSGGDLALGLETGMQRASDMIENIVRRHTEGTE